VEESDSASRTAWKPDDITAVLDRILLLARRALLWTYAASTLPTRHANGE